MIEMVVIVAASGILYLSSEIDRRVRRAWAKNVSDHTER